MNPRRTGGNFHRNSDKKQNGATVGCAPTHPTATSGRLQLPSAKAPTSARRYCKATRQSQPMTTQSLPMIDPLSLIVAFIERYKPDIVGVIGAIIAAWHGRKGGEITGKTDFVVYVISGLVSVHFLTQPVIDLLHLSNSHSPAVGFLVGMFSGSLFAAIRRALRKADIWGLIRSRFGGGPKP